MTIPMWCMVAGLFLPYIWAGASVPLRLSQFGDVDIAHPRAQAERLTAAGSRVVGAQYNAFEALIVFAVANLIALMSGLQAEGNWTMAALVWIGARVGHGVFYLANVPVLRMLSFGVGLGASLWIVFESASI